MNNKKIFIIDIDINISSALEAKFRAEGFEVYANNGRGEIKDIVIDIKQKKPDLVIHDLFTGQDKGFNLLGEIKSDNSIANIFVVAFTNMNDKETKSKCENLGVDLILFKKNYPNLDLFVDKIKKIMINKEKIKK